MSQIPRTEFIEISDHFYRAIHFLNACRASIDLNGYNWNLMASIYSARAIVEITYTNFKDGILGGGPDDFMEEARKNVRRFTLIETIRVQDFHRKPVRFNPNAMSFAGPAILKSSTQRESSVGLSFDHETGKPVEHKFRNASIKYNRTLTINGLTAHDHVTDEMVQIDNAVEEYLIDLKNFLSGLHPSLDEWLKIFFTDK